MKQQVGYKTVVLRGEEWAGEFVTSSYDDALWFAKDTVARDPALRCRIFEFTDSDSVPNRLVWPLCALN